MGAQRQGAGVPRLEALAHQARPEQAGGPQLRHLEEIIHPDAEEEGQSRRELIDLQSRRCSGAHIVEPVGQGVGQFQVRRRPGLQHVVAGDRDGVEPRHELRGIAEDVGYDPHRRLGRIDIGVPHQEFFEYVVLDRARELVLPHALLFGGDDVEGQDRQHRPVHGHGDADPVERDGLEQGAHVVDGIDRHPSHAHVAPDPRVVGIVAAVGGQVEGHRQPRLAAGEVAAIEGVRLFGGGEAGVLADRPRPGQVHGRVGAADEGRQPGPSVQQVLAGHVFKSVYGFSCRRRRADEGPVAELGKERAHAAVSNGSDQRIGDRGGQVSSGPARAASAGAE